MESEKALLNAAPKRMTQEHTKRRQKAGPLPVLKEEGAPTMLKEKN
jgi:hypothetical protein